MEYLNWRHVLTEQNPIEMETRSYCGVKLQPKWPGLLYNEEKWWKNVQTS